MILMINYTNSMSLKYLLRNCYTYQKEKEYASETYGTQCGVKKHKKIPNCNCIKIETVV